MLTAKNAATPGQTTGCVHETVGEDEPSSVCRIDLARAEICADCDDTVRRINTRYNARGLVAAITSWDHPAAGHGGVVSEGRLVYNAFRQLATKRSVPA